MLLATVYMLLTISAGPLLYPWHVELSGSYQGSSPGWIKESRSGVGAIFARLFMLIVYPLLDLLPLSLCWCLLAWFSLLPAISVAVSLFFCLTEGFGNATRIDYGTGHELKFMAFICCLMKIGVIPKEDGAAVVLRIASWWEASIVWGFQWLLQTYRAGFLVVGLSLHVRVCVCIQLWARFSLRDICR